MGTGQELTGKQFKYSPGKFCCVRQGCPEDSLLKTRALGVPFTIGEK